MLGINATPEALAALRAADGPRPARCVWRYLDWIGGMLTLDFGRSYTYSRAGHRSGRRAPRRVAAAGADGARPVDGDRHSASASSPPSGAAAPADAADHGRRAARRRGAEFLVRAAPDLLFAVWLRLVPAGGFPGWSAGVWPALQGADPAGDRAGAAAGGDPRARHPLGAARGARRGLYPHRARQGHAAPRRAVAARAAQRA